MTDEATLTGVPAESPRKQAATVAQRTVQTADAARRWERFGLVALLVTTATMYLWSLGASGWANAFYSAAVQAGTHSWTATFFGSFDSSNFITVDKPPASLWVMVLSARLFGVNSWSILVPEALMGVASVGLLFAAIRRACGPMAGFIAGAVLALTPVAALMFRFNNPDALLVLLLIAAAYAVQLAMEGGLTRWLVIVGVLVGLGFLTKMMQAFVVLPVFGAVYMTLAPVSIRRRFMQLLAAGVSVLLSAGWWVVIVTLIPAADRPYIGGSQTNSVLELIFGYNGFGRLTGNETGSVGGFGGARGATSMWGPTGITRLFNAQFGGQISWLIPGALLLLAVTLWLTRRAPRTDVARATTLIWGGWLLLTGLLLSFAQGIIHPYYTVALAPAVGALVGIGVMTAWRERASLLARLGLSAAAIATAVWAFILLDRSAAWLPWLRYAVLGIGVVTGLALIAPRLKRGVIIGIAAAAMTSALAGPTAYSIDTVLTAQHGAIPSAGPAVANAFGGPGGGGFRFGRQGPGGVNFGGGSAGLGNGAQPPGGFPGGFPGGPGGFPGGPGGPPNGGGPGNGGGLLNAPAPSAAVVTALQRYASRYTWVAAAVGANNAAGYQLGSNEAVMAIGGFNGSDPTPTLAAFQQYVSQGKVHYFITSGTMNGPGGGARARAGGSTSSSITTWVEAHFTKVTVGTTTMYDLTAPTTTTTGPATSPAAA